MKVLNNTHYISVHSLYYNEFVSPNTFCYESSRRNSYLQRLYFEFLDVQRIGGLSFFYTLTYNDASIPTFYGKPCFSYKDIRYVTNGVLSKWLIRNFNCQLRYFVACEYGDGKGKRGLGNNPHYHIIFFVRPVDGSLHGLNQYSFRSKIEEIWQGQSGPCDWRYAKYGHCEPGNDCGLVTSSSAFQYVCKYVTKDASQLGYESWLKDIFFKEVKDAGFTNLFLYSFYHYLINYCSQSAKPFSRKMFLSTYNLIAYLHWRRYMTKYRPGLDTTYESYLLNHSGTHGKRIYDSLSKWFNDFYVSSAVSQMYSEYRNNYSAKVRCSKLLGSYGLEFMTETPDGVKLKINSPSGYKVQSAALYYIRKKYYNIKICPYSGSPLYYLNDDGIRFKCTHLHDDINKLISRVRESYSLLSQLSDTDDIVTNVNLVFTRADLDSLLYRYACYTLVYKYRRYQYFDDIKLSDDCNFFTVLHDYKLFLCESCYNLDYEDCSVHEFLLKHSDDLLSFSLHPGFVDYYRLFNIIDDMLDVVSSYRDSERKKIFYDKKSFQKRHNALKYNQL